MLKENEEANATIIYGRNLTERRSKFAIEVRGTALMDGDYGNAELRLWLECFKVLFYTII
jgi:curli production assembly/transport component CsgG